MYERQQCVLLNVTCVLFKKRVNNGEQEMCFWLYTSCLINIRVVLKRKIALTAFVFPVLLSLWKS